MKLAIYYQAIINNRVVTRVATQTSPKPLSAEKVDYWWSKMEQKLPKPHIIIGHLAMRYTGRTMPLEEVNLNA